MSRFRRIAIGVAGGVLIVVGLVLIPLPGPGIPTIVAGIALLSLEFPWAARTMEAGRSLWARVRPARPTTPTAPTGA